MKELHQPFADSLSKDGAARRNDVELHSWSDLAAAHNLRRQPHVLDPSAAVSSQLGPLNRGARDSADRFDVTNCRRAGDLRLKVADLPIPNGLVRAVSITRDGIEWPVGERSDQCDSLLVRLDVAAFRADIDGNHRKEPTIPDSKLTDVGSRELERLIDRAALTDGADQPLHRIARRDPRLVPAGEPDLNRLGNTKPGFAERHHCPRMGVVSESGRKAAQRPVDGSVAVRTDHHGARPDEAVLNADVVRVAVAAVEEMDAVTAGKSSVLLQQDGLLFVGRREMVIEDHYHALGIAHRALHLLLKNLPGEITAQIVKQQAIDVCHDDIAGGDGRAPARAGEDLFDHVHGRISEKGSEATSDRHFGRSVSDKIP